MKRISFKDYPQLTKEWDQQQCVIARQFPFRLAIYVTEPIPGCMTDEQGIAMVNPYLAQSRDIWLTGYFPVINFEEKGALKLKKGYASVLTSTDINLTENFGSQLESQYYCCVLDLTSEQIRSSGDIQNWTVSAPNTVDVEFVVSATPVNYFEFINQSISTPKYVVAGGRYDN